MDDIKQVIVVRSDLNMRRGKEAAQVAHASLTAALKNLTGPVARHWFGSGASKIVVSVASESDLLGVFEKAQDAGLTCALIRDAGRTEFREPTYTAVAIGPALASSIDEITGELKLR